MRAPAVAIFVACSLAVYPLCASAPDDHLVRPYEDRDWGVHGYSALVQKKLLATPATYGRIVVRPSAGSLGEYSFSLYPSSRSGLMTLTYVRASRNVWSYLSARSPRPRTGPYEPWELAPLRFRRSDGTLPTSAGIALRDALAVMLRGTRGDWPGGREIVLDGTEIQLSLIEGETEMVGVITPALAGENISLTKKLVFSLQAYCEASPVRQPAHLVELKRMAKQLISRARKT